MTPHRAWRLYQLANAAARAAYTADRAHDAGLCATCQTRPRDPEHRTCQRCRKEKR